MSLSAKKVLTGLTVKEIIKLIAPWQQPAFRAGQIYKWIHHQQVSSFDEMTNIPLSFRGELARCFQIRILKLADRQLSADGAQKYLWELPTGHKVESVFIPETKRNTICISSQVGCSLGCNFCATGQMGFLAQLTAGEIVEQVIRIQQNTGQKITNVVFMGMGEPFLNYSQVIQACRILNDPEGLAISANKITISTVGIVPKIYQFTDEKQPFRLAISLHAPSQSLRREMMPIAEKFSLDILMDSAKYYTAKTGKRITFEYILLQGLNDSTRVAGELLKLLTPLKCKLNLIPCNDTGLEFAKPGQSELDRFLEIIQKAPFAVTLRKTRGSDIAAACGQLYSQNSEKQKPRFIL